MMQQGLDLFGQVPVTWPEIYAWCEAVAGIPRTSPRLMHYLRCWGVAEKVARAKLDGTFDATVSQPRPDYTAWMRWRY